MESDDFDYWTAAMGGSQAGSEANPSSFLVETIEAVVPLGRQSFDQTPPFVPPVLRTELFGGSKPGADDTDPSLHTYAVLDAAAWPGLPELLESSGLAHDCLFQRTAAEDLRDVAPWLVRLEDDHALTRSLFTRGTAPHHLWDEEPGIVLRSYAPLEAVRRHLRRFTRVRDGHGTWFYLRFWEPSAFAALATHGSSRLLERLLVPCMFDSAVARYDDRAVVVRPSGDWKLPGQEPITSTFVLDAETWRVMAQHVEDRFLRNLRRDCLARSIMSGEQVDAVIDRLHADRFRSRPVLRELGLWWSTPEGWQVVTSDWGMRELAASRGMPDPVRLARLRNLADDRAS